MRNKKFFQKGKKTYAIVGDGDCEKWYFQMLKHNESLTINIKPELNVKANLKKQFENVKNLADVYDEVFWIVDYDVIERETRECKVGDEKRCDEFVRYYEELSEIKNVEIIVVNTCFEYWLLLHFKYSKKKYSDCDETGRDLKKELPNYEKTEKFYKKPNKDIYTQLKSNLPDAVKHAQRLGNFDVANPTEPVCELYKLFDENGNFTY